ncbi:MAG: hypothetical protein JWO30_2600 [Fibrobacteres bacterium]|nr:hypothetical protein [Fibrobacterota bacterium]
MGAKPFISLPISRRSAGLCLTGAFALAISSCISDGANRTGGEYLSQHGVLLQDPLYHVTLKGIPVDSFWTTDAEPSHLADTILLVGSDSDFSAEARLAFQLDDINSLFRLDSLDATSLKLSLGFPVPPIGGDELDSAAKASSADTVDLEVVSWSTTDSGLTDAQWTDTLNTWNNRFLIRNDTVAALERFHPIRDTIHIAFKTAYTTGSIQAQPLPNLHAGLVKIRGHKNLIECRIRRIPGKSTGPAMLHLGGELPDDPEYVYEPILIFGPYGTIAGTPSSNFMQTMFVGGRRGVNYSLMYSGPKENILTGKVRGLHVVLDRKTLLDSIDADLQRQNLPLQPRTTSGDFDLSYFVPFAKMTLPLDLAKTKLESGFPLQINMVTSIDSLLGDTISGGIRVDTVQQGVPRILWHTYDPGNPGTILDDVSITYDPVLNSGDARLRKVILKFSRDSVFNDTSYIHVGESKQRTTTLQGYGKSFLSLTLDADSLVLAVHSYLTVRPEAENNEYRDSVTGETITDLERRMQKFLHSGDSELSLRAIHGFQRLLNRTRSNANVLQDFQFQPSVFSAVDTSFIVGGDTTSAVVDYPVLSVVAPKLEGKSLKVDVELYLFPLKAR